MTNIEILTDVIRDMNFEERSYLLLDVKIEGESEEICNLCEAGYAGFLELDEENYNDIPF